MTRANRKPRPAPGDRRTVRLPQKLKDGRSVYALEEMEGAPRFTQGDGYDEGRNLLSAVLIGPRWTHLGYVAGERGDWALYVAPAGSVLGGWPEARGRKGSRSYRAAAEPVSSGHATVQEAAAAYAGRVAAAA